MTLSGALAAARDATCATCVDLTYSRQAAEESARRGLVELTIAEPQGGAYVALWAWSGSRWQPFTGYQNTVPWPTRLPSRIWICSSSDAAEVRAGPGMDYPVVASAGDLTPARAGFMTLTNPESIGADGMPVPGAGWLEVDSDRLSGWVSADTVDANEGCEAWRAFNAN